MSTSSMHVIDCHHHVGSLAALGIRASGADTAPDGADPELHARLVAMDRHGIDQAIVIPGHGYLRPNGIADTRTINDEIAAYRDRTPLRFPAALGVVEPLYGRAVCAAELRRMKDELRLVGHSVHARFQGVSTDSPLVIGVVEAAAELGLVTYVHAIDGVADEVLWKVQHLARSVPGAPIVVLDALSGNEQARLARLVGADTPGLVFDVSLAHHAMFVEQLVDVVGPQRVVYGSDYYSMMPPPRTSGVLGDILESDLSDSDKADIVSGNIRRILRLGDAA